MKDNLKDCYRVAIAIADMLPDEQNSFFSSLKSTDIFTEKELESIQIVVAYFRLLKRPGMKEQLKKDMAAAMYKQFNNM